MFTFTHNQCFEQLKKNISKLFYSKFSLLTPLNISHVYISWTYFRNVSFLPGDRVGAGDVIVAQSSRIATSAQLMNHS